jgi:hypothetical protein
MQAIPGEKQQQKEPGPRTQKRKYLPKTKGQKSDGKNERVKIKIRRRVKIYRSQLYHILITDAQHKTIPKNVPNKFCFLEWLFLVVRTKAHGMSSLMFC